MCLGEEITNHVPPGAILESELLLLDPVSDKEVLDLDVSCPPATGGNFLLR